MKLKNYSDSAERNKTHIYKKLKEFFYSGVSVLEVGSGSGQHGIYFSSKFKNISWQFSEVELTLPSLIANVRLEIGNQLTPVLLDVGTYDWYSCKFDMIYTANTLHIMTDNQLSNLLRGIKHSLHSGGKFIVYGPFNYNNSYTSPGNKEFDEILRSRRQGSYIKSFDKINHKLKDDGFSLINDIMMPMNNRLLIWEYS